MKTPWKFLVELTSRRSAKTQQGTIGRETDSRAPDQDTASTPALPSFSTQASGTPDHDEAVVSVDTVPVASNEQESRNDAARTLERPANVEEPQAVEPGEARHSSAELDVLAPKSETRAKLREKRLTKRRERAKSPEGNVVARDVAARSEDQSVQPRSSGNGFFDEAESLDEDIRKLRSELAQKLHLQNAQLKKMLERFEAP